MNAHEIRILALLNAMGVENASVERSEIAGQTIFSIKTTGEKRDLVGQRGDTIHAIDHLVKKMAEQKTSRANTKADSSEESDREPMFLVDVDEYRTRQIKDLQGKAKMMAERARSFQYDVELSPMSAYERLIVHTALASEPNIKTESQGEGRGRRVVIKYQI